MPTKHDHLKDEVIQILETVTGLNVVVSMTGGQEPARPYVRPRLMGHKKKGVGEAVTTEVTALIFLDVAIEHAGGQAGLEEERNRLDNLIEHAFDIYNIAAYADSEFTCSSYIHEYSGASGLFDENQNTGSFTATVEVKYLQTPMI